MKTYIALIRGINVSGRNRVPMKELIPLCNDLGWSDVSTYLQTGNVVFNSSKEAHELELELEQVIVSHFECSVPVIVRAADEYAACAASLPFADQIEDNASRVLLYLSKQAIEDTAREKLEARSAGREQIHIQQGALWIHFLNGIGTSKLTPAVIDKAVGSPATGRNWKTVLKIREMLTPES